VYDAIIIGGGPAGSYTACYLAERGHRVLVLERKPRAGENVCCTGIIGQECVDAFSIDDSVILRKVSSASLYSPSGNCLHIERPQPQACILDRSSFDIAMADRACKAGADYNFNSRATDIIIENDGALVNVIRSGEELQIQARSVVIASGFNPGLIKRHKLGDFRDFTIGVQAEVTAPGVDEVEVHFGDVAPGFFAWLVPVADSMARAGLMTRERPGFYLKQWLSRLAADGKIASDEVKICYGGIPLRPLARTSGQRLLVVGDAAGQVKPTSGGGIYYGLLGAEIAAKTLHQVLMDDDLSAGRLARYEREWRKKLGRELRIGYWARRLFERLSNQQIDRVFEIVKERGIDDALLKLEDLSFDWHSKAILRLLKYQVVARTLDIVKLPFSAGRIDRQTE
jgi:digeranylgeranylglycerophospholipid reductase